MLASIHMQSLPSTTHKSNRSKSFSSQTSSTERYNGSEYRFVTKPAADLYCQKCEEIACEPYQMQCNTCNKSSLFCKKCVPSECLTCEAVCEIFPDGLSKHRIQKLEIMCPNDAACIGWLPGGLGCSWTGELQTVTQHHLECPQEFVTCPYKVIGCKYKEKMNREKLTKHEEDHRKAHIDLTMKQVVSMAKTIRKLEKTVDNLREQISKIKT